ncbi:MAG: creatininase family protein [Pseudomonadota bacterium]
MTWREAEIAFRRVPVAVLATGSTEQHGPMGEIGTDTFCAAAIAREAAARAGAIVLPPLAYTPAPFNMGFRGTLSLPPTLFAATVSAICEGLATHGVRGLFVVNGHGANLAPLHTVAEGAPLRLKVRSWWDFDGVAPLRATFGAHEGMHATPSEISITMALHGQRPVPAEAASPPTPLPDGFIAAHAGDRHGPPEAHRAAFPDGRVGSHSALASADMGKALLEAASAGAAREIEAFARTV